MQAERVCSGGYTPGQEAIELARAAAGDTNSENELWKRHESALRGYVRPRARGNEDADDVVQETWLRWKRMIGAVNLSRTSGCIVPVMKFHARFALLTYYGAPPIGLTGEGTDVTLIDDEDFLERLRELRDRSTDVDALMFLEIAFSTHSLAHELITWAFVRVLDWKPGEVVRELSDRPLGELAKEFESELNVFISSTPASVSTSMQPLFQKLEFPPSVHHIAAAVAPTVLAYNTRLVDYFRPAPPPSHQVVHWWSAVVTRVVVALARLGI